LNNKKKGLIDNTIQNLERVENELRTRPNDWVVDVNEDTETIQFKPIDVARFCAPYFFDHTDVCMFMSATILNKRTFCKWHGIDAKDTCYIQQKSPFDIDRRPIFVKPVGSMAYKSIQNTKPRTIPEIKKIMAKHGNQKGLIHTNSHHLTKYLYEELNDPRVITYTKMSKYDRPNREEVINDFIASDEPLVLVAPSVDEGVDLPGDLCRFQVIYKIPFPDLSDKQIKARMKKDKKWYAYKTVTSLVQSYGRGMRKEDDYCDTYITDKDILSVMNDKWRKCVYFMPEYFTEAVQVCNEN
jgi:Rad3-related DNA helicase